MLQVPWSEEVSEGVALLYLLFSMVSALVWLVKTTRVGRLVSNEWSPSTHWVRPVICLAYGLSTLAMLLAANLTQNRVLSVLVLFQIIWGILLVVISDPARAPYGWLRLNLLEILAFGICGAGAVQFSAFFIGATVQEVAQLLHLPLADQNVVSDFRNLKGWDQIEAALVEICLVGPLLEEIFFRGFIYTSLKKFISVWPAIIVSGAIFGAIHMNPWAFFPLWFMGSILALVYEHTGSLTASFALHGFFNFTTCLAILVFPNGP